MFQIISETHYRFMRFRKQAFVISAVLLLAGVAGWVVRGGFKLGIDFSGVIVIEYLFNQRIPINEVRAAVNALGYSGAEIQDVAGNPRDLLIRIPDPGTRPAGELSPSAQVLAKLKESYPGLEGDLRQEEAVGPKIGSELRRKATLAVLVSLLGILIYIAIRFELVFAVGAVMALFHDVLVTLGVFAIFQREITLPVIAALLTIGGYSVNDTIIVFDRIREQLKIRRRQPLEEVIDISINQTLSRTLITAGTTLCAVLALFILGGQVIHDFALAMIVGVTVGTYSSIFIASACVAWIRGRSGGARRRAAAAARAPA